MPITQELQYSWRFEKEGVINESFDQYGFDWNYITPNLGFIYVLYFLFGFAYVVVALKSRCCSKCADKKETNKCRSWIATDHRPGMFNFNVRFIYESFFIVMLCSILDMYSVYVPDREINADHVIAMLTSFIFMIIGVSFLIWVAIVVCQ